MPTPDLTPEVRRLAAEIQEMRSLIRTQSRASQAAYRGVDLSGGPVAYYDEDGVQRLAVGSPTDDPDENIYTIMEMNGPPPPVPDTPYATPVPGGILYEWDGTFVEANRPADLSRVQLHVSNSSGVEADDDTLMAAFSSDGGGSYLYPVDNALGNQYAKLVAVTRSGVESDPSDEVVAQALLVKGQSDGQVPGQVQGLQVDGGIQSNYLSWLPVANADIVTYKMYAGTTSPVIQDDAHYVGKTGATRGTVFSVYDDTTGAKVSPLVPGRTYFYAVVAADDDGDGPISVTVGGSPVQITGPDIANEAVTTNHLRANTITSDKFSTVLGMASRMEFGQYMSIDATSGLLSDPPNGNKIMLPTDGSQALFDGGATLRNATVKELLDVQGPNNKISGTMQLQSGITDPVLKPSLTWGWNDPSTFQSTEYTSKALGDRRNGMYDNGTAYVYTDVNRDVQSVVASVNKTTGKRTVLLTLPTGFDATGGVAFFNNQWYVLGQDGNRSDDWYIYRYSTTWAKVGETRWNSGSALTWFPVLLSDANYLYIVHVPSSNGVLRLARYNAPFSLQGYADTAIQIGSNTDAAYYGAADFNGGAKLAVALHNGIVYSFNVSGFGTVSGGNVGTLTEDVDQSWACPNNDLVGGMAWDGTRFHMLGTGSGKIWHMAAENVGAPGTFMPVTYSQFDANPTGGQHETRPSPSFGYYPQRRWWLRISGVLGQTSGGPDDPDRLRFYIGNSLQPDVPAGATQMLLDKIVRNGAPAQTANGFASLPSVLGSVESLATDSDGPITTIRGNGSGRNGWSDWDSLGRMTRNRLPTMVQTSGTALQSIPTAALTRVQFPTTEYTEGTARFSVNASYDTFTVLEAGVYQVYAHVIWAASTTANQRRDIELRATVSGSNKTLVRNEFSTGASGNPSGILAGEVKLSAGDTIFIMAYHDNSTAINVGGTGSANNRISIRKIAA